MYNNQNHQLIEQNRTQLKKALKSPVTLILGIMLALTGILTFAYLIKLDLKISDLISSFTFTFSSYFPNYNSSSNDIYESCTTIILLCIVVVPMLSFVGYLLTFTGASNKNNSTTPKGGTALLMGSAILSLLGFAAVLMMYMCSVGTYMEALDSRYVSDEILSKFIRVTLLVAAYVLYGISGLIFSSSANSMCNGQKRNGACSVLYGISAALIGLIYFIYLLDTTKDARYLSDINKMFNATIICSGASYILTAVMAFIFNGHIKANPAPVNAYTPSANPANSNTPYGYYGAYPGTPSAPINQAHQASGYADNFTSNDTPYPAYNPVEDTQTFPVATEPEAVPVRNTIREAEDTIVTNGMPVSNIPAFCPECGTRVEKPDQIFCAECGTRIK